MQCCLVDSQQLFYLLLQGGAIIYTAYLGVQEYFLMTLSSGQSGSANFFNLQGRRILLAAPIFHILKKY
jgi:hypothetical protein